MKRIFLTLTLLATALAAPAQSWTNRYNGPGNGDDSAFAIAVDSSGNVFVTGASGPLDDSSHGESVTIKYSSAGLPLWTNHYKPLAASSAWARAIAVDTNGNVFVTGAEEAVGTIWDYVTIKYSNAGVPLWTNRYNGPGNNSDFTTAVAVDAAGNLFVTGSSPGNESADFATIKYSNAGVPLWTNRYGGEANQLDYPGALAVDASGNVIVTGSSEPLSGSGFATIKYSNAGVPLWTNLYNGPGFGINSPSGLAVDGSGTVFVTGETRAVGVNGDFFDYVTLAYSSAGVPLWTNLYNGPGKSDDGAGGIALDADGNVLVTGISKRGDGPWDDYSVTIKYSGGGVPLWTNVHYNGMTTNADLIIITSLALDASGNVFVTTSSWSGGGARDWVTIKYSSAGVLLSTNLYDGAGSGDDNPWAIVVDRSGNAFVTGFSDGVGSGLDFVTIKYAAEVSLDGFAPNPTGGSFPEVRALALQPDGNILVGGAFDILAGQTRGYLGRVQPDGSLDPSFQPPTNPHVSVWMFSLMPDGIITSDMYSGSRLLPDGTQLPPPNPYYMIGMASLPDGRVVITDAVSPMEGVLRRLNADGSADTGFEIMLAMGFASAVLAQPDGAILVGVSADLTGTQNPYSITRILPNGTVDPGFHAETDDGVATMVLQADGKIVMGGFFTQVNGVPRQHLARLNPNGTLDGAFDPAVTPGGGAGPIFSLALQTDGRILVAGDFSSLAGEPCSDLGRLNQDGSFDPSFNLGSDNFVMALAIEQDGNVLVGGRFTTLGGQPRSNLGRILNTESATETLTMGGSSITWMRGGSGPEVWTTTFEVSSDGTNWTQLGVGTRISGGWQLGGISVPAGSQVRARGYVTGGSWNASSWYVESLATFGTPRPSLSITHTGASNLTISWPSPSTGWNLEQNTTLSGGIWITPPETIDDNGTTKSITVNATTGSRFFRLAQ